MQSVFLTHSLQPGLAEDILLLTPADVQVPLRREDMGSRPAAFLNQSAQVASWNSSPRLRNSIATCPAKIDGCRLSRCTTLVACTAAC